MSRLLVTSVVTSRLGFFGRLVNVRLLSAARDVRGVEESPTRARDMPATIDAREMQPSRAASIIGADVERHLERLDAVAGSEFVDDRIRLRE